MLPAVMQVCAHGHEQGLQDILARAVVLEAVPCPSCIKNKQAPPYCFPRQKFVNLPDASSRSGTMPCPKCRQSGRHYFIKIFDIFSPEVFLSYNLGNYDRSRSFYTTNEVAKRLRTTLEREVDVACWIDESKERNNWKGTGAMQDEARYQALRIGVERSAVVILLLSDAYVNTDSCKREYCAAINSQKVIIPVLLSRGEPADNGYNSGWTGPISSDNWWHHAHITCVVCKDPDTGRPFSWSALSQFKPVTMQDGGGAAEMDIVRRVTARFHR